MDGRSLDLGALDAPAAHDHDGDGTVETRRAELEGLAGQAVRVRGTALPGQPVEVRALGDRPWRGSDGTVVG